MKTNNDLTQLKQALHQHTHGFCWCTCVSTCKHERILLADQIRILKKSQPLTWHHPYTEEELESMGWRFAHNKTVIFKYVNCSPPSFSKTIEISKDNLRLIGDPFGNSIIVFSLPFKSSMKAADILCGDRF